MPTPSARLDRARRLLAEAQSELSHGAGVDGQEHAGEVFQHSFQSICVVAPDGTTLDANRAALSLLATARTDVIGLKLWDLPCWGDSAALLGDVRAAVAAVAAGAFVRFEADVQVDAGLVTLDLAFKAVPGRNGRTALIMVEGRDVGARARAERALRESEERFNRIVSIAADAIISIDETHHITLFNHGAEQIFGYEAAEVLGKPLEILLPSGLGSIHAKAVAQFAAGTVAARRMGERREIFGRRQSGEVFRADASISKVTVGGRVVFTAVVRDVTDRWTREQERTQLLEVATRAREDAERERERMQFLTEVTETLSQSLDYEESLRALGRLLVPRLASLCLIDVADADGRVRRVEALHAEPVMQPLADALRTITLGTGLPNLSKEVFEKGVPVLIPNMTEAHRRAVTQSQSHHDVLAGLGIASYVAVPLRARDATLGVVGLARDASAPAYDERDLRLVSDIAHHAALAIDNARLYGRAQEASRQRDLVLGVVSHDLRNPLSAITMCATALNGDAGHDAGERARLASTMVESANWAQRLISDLLDIASIEAGRLSFDPRPTDPVLAAAQVVHLFEVAASERSIDLVIDIDDDVPHVLADGGRLLQVLANLVSNALKFVEPGGRITISASDAEDAVVFAVEDTGPGIAPEHVPRLFDRFWHARRGNESRGTGLGLAIAQGIVQAHGGRIWVETAVGKGSTFRLTLPKARPSKAVPRTGVQYPGSDAGPSLDAFDHRGDLHPASSRSQGARRDV